MKEKISRLAKGQIDYQKTTVLFSQEHIEGTIIYDQKKREEFRISGADQAVVKGLVYSTNGHVIPITENFIGRDCRILYEIDATYAQEDITGEFQIVTGAGEYTIPFCYHVCLADPEGNSAETLPDFARMAKEDSDAALRLFESSDFKRTEMMQDLRLKALYDGLCGKGNRKNAMEEFLIAAGAKEPVTFLLPRTEHLFEFPVEPITDTIVIRKTGWGYLQLTLEADCDFIRLDKKVITEADFDGEECRIGCTILKEKMHAGVSEASVRIRGLRNTEIYRIHVKLPSNREWKKELAFKKSFYSFVSQFIRYQAGLYEEKLLLNGMQTALAEAYEAAEDKPLIRLYQADVCLLQNKRDEAAKLLDEARNPILDRREEDVAAYCYYMYLKSRESNDATQKETMLKLVRKYWEEGIAPDMTAYILLREDPELKENESLALSRMKEQYRLGSRSPYLYLAAVKIFSENTELLRVMDGFELHALYFGIRNGLISEKLAKAAAAQAMQVKKKIPLYRHLLELLYEAYPDKEILTGICALQIRTDCREAEAFRWYQKGVEEDISLTRLYEYYLYALPEEFEEPLPKMLLMYFSYHHTLDYHTQARLYLNVLKYMADDETIMREYSAQIETFAVEQLFQSHMNPVLAQIYSRMIIPQIVDEKIARMLPKLLYAKEIRCEDPGISQVILCYREMKGEITASVRGGRAYVPIYLDDVCILFQDEFGNRYTSIAYTVTDLMNCPELEKKTLELYPTHEMLRLRTCRRLLQNGSYTSEEIETLKAFSNEEHIRSLFRKQLISEIISYYYKMEETAQCDEYLLELDKKFLRPQDRSKVMDALITKDYYEEAYKMAAKYGYESLSQSRLLKLTSKMILRRLFANEMPLLEMAWKCFDTDRYDAVILEYLCHHYNGLAKDMYRVLIRGREEHVTLYDLPERLLAQMLFAEESEHLDDAFRIYAEGKAPDKLLIHAYLVVKSSRFVMEGTPLGDTARFCMEEELNRSKEVKNALPDICFVALAKVYSTEKNLTEQQKDHCQDMVDELCRKQLLFAYFEQLAGTIALPKELAGKMILEYRSQSGQNVWIREKLLPDGKEEIMEPMRHIIGNYYVRPVFLFYGESMEYRIYEGNEQEPSISGVISYEEREKQPEDGRAARLDALLRNSDKTTVAYKEQLEAYAVRDEITERLFESL